MNTRTDNDRVLAVSQMVTRLTKAVKEELDRATRTCLNCSRFDEPNELCGKYGGRPPARIIVLGCDGHEDEIPF